VQPPVEVIDVDLEADVVVAAQLGRVVPFFLEGLRLAEHVARVRLAGVDEHEADPVAELRVQAPQDRPGAFGDRAGAGSGDQQDGQITEVVAAEPAAVQRRQVEGGYRVAGAGCLPAEGHVVDEQCGAETLEPVRLRGGVGSAG